jgi:molybdenum cofactor biosynthesis enzyme MoaA
LVEMLRDVGDLDLTLTTNGALLARQAGHAPPSTRVTVSLD